MDKDIKVLLKERFVKKPAYNLGLSWKDVEALLTTKILDVALNMEKTGGEPAVVSLLGHIYIIDAVEETPKGRLSLCYDRPARLERKSLAPVSSALEEAGNIGVKLLDEQLYIALQRLDDFDLKTSSWLLTDHELRNKGGALFGDKRYGRTFIYHNGASSYYSSRGFRGYIILK